MISFLFIILFSGFFSPHNPPDPSEDYDCPDLVLEELKVIKRTRKVIFLEYKLKNIGTAPAPLKKIKALKSKKIGLRFHFSGDSSLSRGDILADGAYIRKSVLPADGLLLPDSSITATSKISLAKKNSFNNYLITKIDPFSMLIECNEANNTISILLD